MVTVKKIVGKLHLWLGLSSGLIVFVIAITGCIYAFQVEIQDMTQPYRFVTEETRPVLPPSRLKKIAEEALPDKHVHAVLYEGTAKAAQVIFFSFEPDYYYQVFVNPYSGEVLQVENMETNFFHFILDGHFYLWLPPKIGQPLAASATLIFVVMLITGIILWWPRHNGAAKQRFSIKWNARWRRKNYDLHNVLGFYVMSIAIVLSLTGLVWGFQWFAQTYYTVAGGKSSLVYMEPPSDTTAAYAADVPAIDRVWHKMRELYPAAEVIEVHTPVTATSSIAANANPDASTYYKTDYRFFDQYTLKELPVNHIFGRYDEAQAADKLLRMNYDIHVGAILGLPGKVLAFFASLICASLPVTGTCIWWGRRKKAKNERLLDTRLSRAKDRAAIKSPAHSPEPQQVDN